MNLRYWNKQHTIGLLLGILSIFVFLPVVAYVYTWTDNSSLLSFSFYWNNIFSSPTFRCKAISLAVIPNLGWFYLALNKRNYNFAMGIILASAFFIPYIIYVNLL